MSVIGSVVISLSAPLITGILITRTRPNMNRWVLIEQWSTRPRAAIWIIWINLGMMFKSHWNENSEPNLNSKINGYLDTAAVTFITEFFISFFGIKTPVGPNRRSIFRVLPVEYTLYHTWDIGRKP